jgi:outer membrane immunogenic protein
MREVLIAILGAGAFATSATAADLMPYYKAPLPIATWTGIYAGVNLGWYGSADDTLTNTGTDSGTSGLGSALAAGLIPGLVNISHSGLIGGVQGGFNWQVYPNWVVGIEADFDGTTGSGKTVVAASPGNAVFPPFSTVFSRGLEDVGTIRARVGWLSSPTWLWYATGGLAYGQTKLASAWLCPACAPMIAPDLNYAQTSTPVAVGWTAGGGVEWRFAPAWSLKLEYLYVDLGSTTNTIGYNYLPFFGSTLSTKMNDRDDVVRAGLNYRLW